MLKRPESRRTEEVSILQTSTGRPCLTRLSDASGSGDRCVGRVCAPQQQNAFSRGVTFNAGTFRLAGRIQLLWDVQIKQKKQTGPLVSPCAMFSKK